MESRLLDFLRYHVLTKLVIISYISVTQHIMLRSISAVLSGGSTLSKFVKVRYFIINYWIAKLFEQNLFVGIREGPAMFLYHLKQIQYCFCSSWLVMTLLKTVSVPHQAPLHRSPPSSLSASFEVQCGPYYFPMCKDRG